MNNFFENEGLDLNSYTASPSLGVNFVNNSSKGSNKNFLKTKIVNNDLSLELVATNLTSPADLTPGQKLILPPKTGFSPTGTLFCLYHLDDFLSEEQITNFINDQKWVSQAITDKQTKRRVLVFAPKEKITLNNNEPISISLSNIKLSSKLNKSSVNLELEYWNITPITIIPSMPQTSSFKIIFEGSTPGQNLQNFINFAIDQNQEEESIGDAVLLVTSFGKETVFSNNFSLQMFVNHGAPEIKMNKDSKFIISFIYGSSTDALVPTSEITTSNYNLDPGEKWKPTPQKDFSNPKWVLSLKESGNIPEFNTWNFKEINTNNPPGLTLMYIQYENIEGFEDGYFTLAINKTSEVSIRSFSAFPSQRLGFGEVKFSWDIDWGYGNNEPAITLNEKKITSPSKTTSTSRMLTLQNLHSSRYKEFTLQATGTVEANYDTKQIEVSIKPKILSITTSKDYITTPSDITISWEVDDPESTVSIIYDGQTIANQPYKGTVSINLRQFTSICVVATNKNTKHYDFRYICVPYKLYSPTFSSKVSPSKKGFSPNTSMKIEKNEEGVFLRCAYFDEQGTIHFYKYQVYSTHFEEVAGFPKLLHYKADPNYKNYEALTLTVANTKDDIFFSICEPKDWFFNNGKIIRFNSNNTMTELVKSINQDLILAFKKSGLEIEVTESDTPFIYSSLSLDHGDNLLMFPTLYFNGRDVITGIITSYSLQNPISAQPYPQINIQKPKLMKAIDHLCFSQLSIYKDNISGLVTINKKKVRQPIEKLESELVYIDSEGKNYPLSNVHTYNAQSTVASNDMDIFISSYEEQSKTYKFSKESKKATEITKTLAKGLEETVINAVDSDGNKFYSGENKNRLYGYDYKTSSIIAMDYNEFFVSDTIKGFSNPSKVIYTHDDTQKIPYAIVLNNNKNQNGWVTVINLNTNQAVPGLDHIMVNDTVNNMTLIPQSTQLFITNTKGKVYPLHIDFQNKTYTLSHAIKSPGGKELIHIKTCPIPPDTDGYLCYITTNSDEVFVFNTKYKVFLPSLPLPLGAVGYGLAFSRGADLMFVSDNKKNCVYVFDTFNGYLLHTVAVGEKPVDITVSENEDFAYCANADGNSISIIDLKKYTSQEVEIGFSPSSLALSPGGNRLFIGPQSNVDNITTIGIMSTHTNQLIQILPQNIKISSFCMNPDGSVVYASGKESGSLLEISPLKSNSNS